MPEMPTRLSSRDSRILWSTRSKAAERSSRTKMAGLPESTVKIRLLKTFKRADSVLCPGLKPDWNFS